MKRKGLNSIISAGKPAVKREGLRTQLFLQANRQTGSEKEGPQNSIIAAGKTGNSQTGSEKGGPQNSIIAAGKPANRQFFFSAKKKV